MTKLARAALLVLAVLWALPAAAPAGTATPCDRFAAAAGGDTAAGTEAAPVRTLRRLAQLLEPGQTGCLRPGDTFHDLAFLEHGGGPDAPITLTSGPGPGVATLTGQYVVNADHVRIRHLRFAGLGAAAQAEPKSSHLMVNGDDVQILDSEITSPKGTCLDVGDLDAYAAGEVEDGHATRRADDFVLAGSRVHDCGRRNWADGDFTSQDSGVHGVYLVYARHAVLRDNLITGVINRGIQLWPAASDVLIEHNTLDGNGSNVNLGSSASYGHFTTGAVVRDNLITNAELRSSTTPGFPHGDDAQLVGFFPDDADRGNRVVHNCFFGVDPALDLAGRGFTAADNLHADPRYRDRGAGDFRIPADSPCAGMGARFEEPVTPPQPSPVTPAPPPARPGAPRPLPPAATAPARPARPAAAPAPRPTSPLPGPAPRPRSHQRARPALRLLVPAGQTPASVRRAGLRATVRCAAACRARLVVRVDGRVAARASFTAGPCGGGRTARLRLPSQAVARLANAFAPAVTVRADAGAAGRRVLRVMLAGAGQRVAGA